MNNEQKLEAVINHYRQLLADEQFKVVQLNVVLQENNQRINELERELEGYRVPAKSETTDSGSYDPL